MEANKEEQLLALLDAKKDEFCTAKSSATGIVIVMMPF